MIGADCGLARPSHLEYSPTAAAHNGPRVVSLDSWQQDAKSLAIETAAHR
jgi:hypothetical protein